MKLAGIIAWGLFLLCPNLLSQDPNLYIFLCFGQSNMQGAGTIEEMDLQVDPRFRVMEAVDCSNLGRTKGAWYPAVPPLCRCYSGLSPADYFGRTLVANLPDSIRVGVVNISVAGCRIELYDKENYQEYVSTVTEEWLMDIINSYNGNPYGYLVEMAQRAQQDGIIKGILLHQGESNTGDSMWPGKVKGIYTNLVSDLGLNPDSVPLLAGEVVHADQGGVCASMNAIIGHLPDSVPNAYVISSSGCTDSDDNLHFNAEGYRELGRRYAVRMLTIMGYDPDSLQLPGAPPEFLGTRSVFFEPECGTVGPDWDILSDSVASNGKYVTAKPGVQSISEAQTDSTAAIYFSFAIDTAGYYNLFARTDCHTYASDSYWVRLDDEAFEMSNGLLTSGWQWIKLTEYDLEPGEHTLTVTYRENGAKLDKLCISNYADSPVGLGEMVGNCEEDTVITGTGTYGPPSGYALDPNYPNPFSERTTIAFRIPAEGYVSLKVFDMVGAEIAELEGKVCSPGVHKVEFESGGLAGGYYVYRLRTKDFIAVRKMIKVFKQ